MATAIIQPGTMGIETTPPPAARDTADDRRACDRRRAPASAGRAGYVRADRVPPQLESAIAFFDRKDPVPPARDDLQASLDAVLAEQESRRKLADA
jgi:hypothetical protein